MILTHIRRTRRPISAAIIAVFTAAALLVCVPVPAAAGGNHCASVSAAAQAEHCDMPATTMDCCVEERDSQDLPATPQNAGSIEKGSTTLVPQTGIVPQFSGRLGRFPLRAAPVHGHRLTDLPTLNSTFLI